MQKRFLLQMMWWINKHKLPLLMFLFFVLYHSMPSGNVYGSEIWHGIFWWLNFGPGIFGGWRGRGCVWGPGDFWGVWFLPPFDHSRQDKTCHLKPGVPTSHPPPPPHTHTHTHTHSPREASALVVGPVHTNGYSKVCVFVVIDRLVSTLPFWCVFDCPH